MKTLDEVVRALEKCMADDAIESEGVYLAKDALFYLKEYQAILPLVPSLINTAIEVQRIRQGKTIG